MRRLSPEELRIVDEDAYDLYLRIRDVIGEYVRDNPQFLGRTVAMCFALSNAIGGLIVQCPTDDQRDVAVDILCDVVTAHVNKIFDGGEL